MTRKEELLQDVVIKFAGDSGDGMQLTGQQFTNNTALLGIDLATFPDFPAEIRAPIGTLPGVSGFQLRFSSDMVYTPGDHCDVLVAMNAAALKVNLKSIKPGGKIIANVDGFDNKNLRLANYPDGVNPLEDGSLDAYDLTTVDVTKLTREALKDFTELGTKERDRAKNMFVLGLIYWMYNRTLDSTIDFLTEKFGKKPVILQSNIKVLQAGYNLSLIHIYRNRNNTQPSSWWVRNTDFVRLKTLELSYNLPKSWYNGIFRNASVYLQAINPITFSKFKLWDVESTVNAGNGGRYPNVKSYSLGVTVDF